MLSAAVDSASGVGVFAALAAGVVSFLSPCVLPLVPGYLSAVTGVSVTDLDDVNWRRVLAPSLLFVASFSAIFILLGLTATGIGSSLRDHLDSLTKISGYVIIAMGVLFIASSFVVSLNREWRVDGLLRRAGSGGPIIAGAAFAIAWTPCIGPTLASILSAAAIDCYSAGLAIPFLVTALAFSRMTTAFSAIKRHYRAVVIVGGVILIAMGVLIVTGDFFQLNVSAQKWTNDLGLNI
jgi:cytochrome c-type biogenesis protein